MLVIPPAGMQPLVRAAVPLAGQRLLFVSRGSAEMVRQALVLEQYEGILRRRAQLGEQDTEQQGLPVISPIING